MGHAIVYGFVVTQYIYIYTDREEGGAVRPPAGVLGG